MKCRGRRRVWVNCFCFLKKHQNTSTRDFLQQKPPWNHGPIKIFQIWFKFQIPIRIIMLSCLEKVYVPLETVGQCKMHLVVGITSFVHFFPHRKKNKQKISGIIWDCTKTNKNEMNQQHTRYGAFVFLPSFFFFLCVFVGWNLFMHINSKSHVSLNIIIYCQ